jgi:hypothetical protein
MLGISTRYDEHPLLSISQTWWVDELAAKDYRYSSSLQDISPCFYVTDIVRGDSA